MIRRLLAEEREHEEIGVPDRTWERKLGSGLAIALRILSEYTRRETSVLRMAE